MSRRGSAQLLLLFFRPRRGLGRTIGAIAGAAFAAGLVLSGVGLSSLAPSELVHLVRQSVWDRAFAGLPEHAPWPWAATPNVTPAEVPRLGLSASVMQGRNRDRYTASAKPWLVINEARNEPEAMPGAMAIGDRITVTTASGASRVYRVTGRKIVDPHLAESGLGAFGGDAALVTCQPHDSASTLQLVIQATTNDLPATELKEEQKL